MEALGAMAKANAYPLMSLRNNTKIARKGKAAQNFLKKSRKTSVRKSEVLLGGRGAATTTSWEYRSTTIGTYNNKSPPNNPTLIQKLKELVAEAEDDKDIVNDLTPKEDSGNNGKSRDHITTKYTVIQVLIYCTGYTRPTIVHSLAKVSLNKDRYEKKRLGTTEKRESENYMMLI